MRVPSLGELKQSIESQQMAIIEADRRVADRISSVRTRSQMLLPSARKTGLISAVAGLGLWWLGRRRRSTTYSAARNDRLGTVIQVAMPLLMPVIGARAVALLTALAVVPSTSDRRVVAQGRPRTVSWVDLNRYAGTWYEIARFPMLFERACSSDVTATYELPSAGGGIRVVNRCTSARGRVITAKGRARVSDSKTNAKLRVTFAPSILQVLPFVWADYWVLELGDDYDYALVGTPDRRYLWVLSRAPVLADGVYRTLVMQAAAQGYDVQKLERTQHRSAA